jgi:hypothetical protein
MSCAPVSYFYQLQKIESEDVSQNDHAKIVSEFDDVDIIANFWADGGNTSFMIYNKTDSNIFIDLGKSHLIINGVAHTYFQNRAFAESSSSTISSGSSFTTGSATRSTYSSGYGTASYYGNSAYARAQTTSTSYSSGYTSTTGSKITTTEDQSVSFGEMRVICIPPRSGKMVDGFIIQSSTYRDCDLLRYPGKKQTPTKKFDFEQSPLKFLNLITYGFNEELKDERTLEISYWVSEISNYSYDKFVGRRKLTYCAEELLESETYWLLKNPQYFYIEYKKLTDTGFIH